MENAPPRFKQLETPTHFIHNSGGSFTLLCIPLIQLIIIKFLLKIKGFRKLKPKLQEILDDLQWNGFIDTLWTVYLNLCFSAFLQFKDLRF